MKKIISTSFILISIISLISCEQLTENNYQFDYAPSRELSVNEIMHQQGISSIHYIKYDSIIVNGNPFPSFRANNEYYIDSCHYKSIQYYQEKPNYNTTVYNICDNIVWNYSNNKLTYPDLPNWPAAFEQSVSSRLGSWLKGIPTYLGTEIVDGKLCEVYEDSTGTVEWVWREYKLPIQRRSERSYDVHQITVTKKVIVTINQAIPSEVYDPPE